MATLLGGISAGDSPAAALSSGISTVRCPVDAHKCPGWCHCIYIVQNELLLRNSYEMAATTVISLSWKQWQVFLKILLEIHFYLTNVQLL